MLTFLYSIVFAVSLVFVVSQYEFPNRVVPMYIQHALQKKDSFKPMPHAKTVTLSNLTLSEVIEKIRDITAALNMKAKRNGFKVNYTLRTSPSRDAFLSLTSKIFTTY